MKMCVGPAPLSDIYNMTHNVSLHNCTNTKRAFKDVMDVSHFCGQRRKRGKEDASLEKKSAGVWWEHSDTAWKYMHITFSLSFSFLIALIIRCCEPGKIPALGVFDIEHAAQNKHLYHLHCPISSHHMLLFQSKNSLNSDASAAHGSPHSLSVSVLWLPLDRSAFLKTTGTNIGGGGIHLSTAWSKNLWQYCIGPLKRSHLRPLKRGDSWLVLSAPAAK